MDDKLVMNLFSSESIEIKNVSLLKERQLMKVKLFIKQISSLESIFGENEIILYCSNNTVVEYAEKIINFFTTLNIDYKVDDKLEELIKNNSKKKKEAEANIDLLKKIKSDEISNNEMYINFQKKCDSLLKITLKDYQYKSSFLLAISKSGFDFSVPGSGKTIITYATYAYLRDIKRIEKILIIGPKNAYNAWFEEYITCFGQKPKFKNLSDENIKEAQDYLKSSVNNHKEVTFINIEKIRNLEKELILFLDSSSCMLVIDEGHKVKNPDASSTKVAMTLAKYSNFKIVLTGTPMPNGYEDLFSLSYIINPYKSIIPYNFSQLRKFTIKGINEEDEKTIMTSLYPYYSRVSKKHLIDRGELLPPKFNINFSDMDDDQRYIYDFLDGLLTDYHNKWELEFERILMKAILIRKMQVSSNPKLLRKSLLTSFDELKGDLIYNDDADEITPEIIEEFKRKLAIADEIINKDLNNSIVGGIVKKYINNEKMVNKNTLAVELTKKLVDENKKVILWDTFVENMDTLQSMLKKSYKIDAGIINGTVVGDERQEVINKFRYENLKVLIASPATLAESISLHKCCQNAIYVNRNFNAAQFIQSKDRIHRINMPDGLTANYFFLINRNSVDEGVSERLELKESRMLRILDADNIQIGSLENQDNSAMSEEDVIATCYK